MDSEALELYLYMGSTKPIIEWLEKEGCKTKDEARRKLQPLVKSNLQSVLIGGKGSLAGTANGVEKILNHFVKLK